MRKVATLIIGSLMSTPLMANTDQNEVPALVKTYGGALKGALTTEMKAGGPGQAIIVCSEKASAIASQISADNSPWQVNRVSLKPRGSNATPDAWEAETLKWFESQLAAGADPKTLEKFEIVKMDGKDVERYMKPAITASNCLACHGSDTQLAPTVKEKLAEAYPNDQAINHQEGDLRGAVSLKKILN